ncbi:MAG: VWA domain-containing protein [Alphaproteobacteria bacterium]|jgi:hypothetical protein|nr:VWA domain-containing protein [Alphaproteobacteria bacterium]MDP6816586.1 VWA domain-containing protein [Alphaproteobacteria bacterium]
MTAARLTLESSAPDIKAASEALFSRLLGFRAVLRAGGFNVTSGRMIDAVRSLRHIDLIEPDAMRLALRLNIAASRDEEERFDQLFNAFWLGASEIEQQPTEIELEPRPDDRNREHPEMPPDLRGDPMQWSSDGVTRELDLAARWREARPDIEALLRELTRRLATRPSRRLRPARRGRRVDLRRSLRRNLRHGMDLVELSRTRRRVRKTRLVLFCDVSGSMDSYNPFLLEFMFGLQKSLANSRTVVFSTEATEISAVLRQHSVRRTLSEISRRARHWSGGTDIGGALAILNRDILGQGAPSSTVAIILSDGYDQGDAARIESEMRALRRRVRTVVWVNPLFGSDGYAPIAKGMRAALPHVDHFLPAHDIGSLHLLCRDLARI